MNLDKINSKKLDSCLTPITSIIQPKQQVMSQVSEKSQRLLTKPNKIYQSLGKPPF